MKTNWDSIFVFEVLRDQDNHTEKMENDIWYSEKVAARSALRKKSFR